MVTKSGRRAAALCAVLIIAVSCGDDAPSDVSLGQTSTPIQATTLPYRPSSLVWRTCGDVECADLVVPYDYFTQPTGTFTLKLTRRRALQMQERVGVLIAGPRGPGKSGGFLVRNAGDHFTAAVLDRFDVVSWDPRGTGESTPTIDCVDDVEGFFAQPLTADSGERFVDGCVGRSGDLLEHVGTADSARDIESIRRALGEDEVSYVGSGDGGLLGLVWKSMFPDTVRAIVLDAPPSPIASRSERIASRAAGFEKLLDDFLKTEDLVPTWDALTVDPPEGVTKRMVLAAAVSAIGGRRDETELKDALTKAAIGDGTKITELYRGYLGLTDDRPNRDNTFESALATSCVDDIQDVPPADLTSLAPRLVDLYSPEEICRRWPVRSDEPFFFRTGGRSPTVIIGATRDPVSPFVGVQAAASVAGNVRLVTIDGSLHGSYPDNDCVATLIDDYLVELADVPNAVCKPN